MKLAGDGLALVAILNGVCVVLILAGWVLIRSERKLSHAVCMTLAYAATLTCLGVWIAYCRKGGWNLLASRYPAHAFTCFLLISHLGLGLVTVPMIAATMVPAFRADWRAHRRMSNFVLPAWLCISVAGVALYLFLELT